MAKRHYKLSLAEALSAHERALKFGGLGGILNLSLVESAIARPYCGYYRPIWKKAAALVQSMAGNHGFADGNKRTTLILVHTLIAKSHFRLVPLKGEDIEVAIEEIIFAAAGGKISLDQLMNWFKARVVSTTTKYGNPKRTKP